MPLHFTSWCRPTRCWQNLNSPSPGCPFTTSLNCGRVPNTPVSPPTRLCRARPSRPAAGVQRPTRPSLPSSRFISSIPCGSHGSLLAPSHHASHTLSVSTARLAPRQPAPPPDCGALRRAAAGAAASTVNLRATSRRSRGLGGLLGLWRRLSTQIFG
jgi:hypothetical protein